MVWVPRPPPTEERKREYRQGHAVGQFLKAIADNKPPETGATQLGPVKVKVWNKVARRYRYEKGITVPRMKDGVAVFVNMGGKFTSAPDDAPEERKKGYRKKNKKRRSR